MPIRAYRIVEISNSCTFELVYDGLLFDILDELDKLSEMGEGHGTIVITKEDLPRMKKLLSEAARDYSAEEVVATEQAMRRIRSDLDPKWGYVIPFP